MGLPRESMRQEDQMPNKTQGKHQVEWEGEEKENNKVEAMKPQEGTW